MIHLVKLCVGIDSYADFEKRLHFKSTPTMQHVTRMWPKREKELLEGGSLYWVIKGQILVRQKILGFEEVRDPSGKKYCAITLKREAIKTAAVARKPFQGWRYLKAEDAPADLKALKPDESALPDELEQTLKEIGLF